VEARAHADLENLIKKVVLVAKTQPIQKYWDLLGSSSEAYSLEDAAGNHAFDDYPEIFGISEEEGHQIRSFFQQARGCRYDDSFRAYVQSLIDSVVVD
jgi:hypothetical protein